MASNSPWAKLQTMILRLAGEENTSSWLDFILQLLVLISKQTEMSIPSSSKRLIHIRMNVRTHLTAKNVFYLLWTQTKEEIIIIF